VICKPWHPGPQLRDMDLQPQGGLSVYVYPMSLGHHVKHPCTQDRNSPGTPTLRISCMSCVDAADHHFSGPVLSLDVAWRCYCRDRDGIILPEPGRDGRPRSQNQGSDTEHQITSGLALYSMPILLFDSLTAAKGWVNVHTCRLHRPCRHSHSCLGRHCNWLNIDLSSCKKKKCLTLAVGDFTQSEATESFPSGDNASILCF
jgi:hypothetical protein